MGNIVKIISTKIENYVISTVKKRIGFPTEHFHFSQSGDDSPPLPDDKAFIIKKDGTGNYIVMGNLMISQGAKIGEKILYSRDSDGNIKSKLYLNNAGEFIFNDGSDNAVRYSKLEQAFNQLKQDFDNFVSSVYGSHTHIVTTPDTINGTASPTTAQGTPSTADITGSKIEEIKLP